ncbi:hypothetical protein PHYBLDRAFT_174749 [Phycomyces blakesleeanus NRRL 1555(-)]|uniref:Uncharacterized protein n=1 Tax=Phycomyces blakesleeanus (strain ATCC 8743b / DSM 1359 / FGSC 10004 / NBRC 33097 / NRRL 1555) TaxID=763407 RepID=A0A167K173_PHYB8|nr:hypothetical protein PHYBLDRAFT_174749 [Phycomyces blakesleeanus NRRL 1555(-)]OAD67040.1 hypothetical protein PHYBLDRAFT_174749 [Phycomyces blakesleeanus NRRL 1555(-)]|eukprot:XP_018285080.1 hypothetical protein PHYBLDRAFT_174749 [Phycomyces blakesleeanus NRRL 1555(-)]
MNDLQKKVLFVIKRYETLESESLKIGLPNKAIDSRGYKKAIVTPKKSPVLLVPEAHVYPAIAAINPKKEIELPSYKTVLCNTGKISHGVLLMFNLKSNGWCGFRIFAYLKEGRENQFPLVKKMLATMVTHGKLYKHNFGMDVAEVTEIIAFGSEIDSALEKNIPYCPFSM